MPIGIMGSKSWGWLIEVHGVEQEGRRNYEYTGLCCFLLQALNTLSSNHETLKFLLPIITVDIVVYASPRL